MHPTFFATPAASRHRHRAPGRLLQSRLGKEGM